MLIKKIRKKVAEIFFFFTFAVQINYSINKKSTTMKKIFTLLVALFVAFSFTNAQTILSESFEGESVQNWAIMDYDGDGQTWLLVSYEGAEEFGFMPPPDGIMATWSYSWNTQTQVPLTPDNWLISPQITMPAGNTTLTFYAWGDDEEYAAEHLGIYVYAGELPSDGTVPVDDFVSAFEQTVTGSQTEYSVDLSSYAGQGIHIAFRHYNVSDMFALCLDDINVTAGATTGIEDINATANVYPNPAQDVVNVNAASQISNIELFNIAGQKVSTFNVNNTTTQIDVTELANGIYFLKINTEDGMITKKINVVK